MMKIVWFSFAYKIGVGIIAYQEGTMVNISRGSLVETDHQKRFGEAGGANQNGRNPGDLSAGAAKAAFVKPLSHAKVSLRGSLVFVRRLAEI